MVRAAVFIFSLLLFAACPGPDAIPPTVRFGFPLNGDTVAGSVTVRVYATDNRGVVAVEFLIDDSLAGVDSAGRDSIFEWQWDLSGYQPGSSHRLQARALDRAGNQGSSEVIEVVTLPFAGTYHYGTISADETWLAEDNPHYITGDLRVEAVLTVEPGVNVLFAPGAGVTVGSFSPAGIRAEGRVGAWVRFSAVVPETGWQGIEFKGRSDRNSCILRNCVFEDGGNSGATVTVNSCWLVMEVCSLKNSAGAGVVCQDGGFSQFQNNVITGCAGFPVVVDAKAAGSLGPGNELRGNMYDFVQITGGRVEHSLTWQSVGVPYYVSATVTVAGDSLPRLTVAPGCTLLFADSAKVRVGVGRPGALNADGSYGQIVFAGMAGVFWGGIEFWNSTITGQTVLKNCLVDGAGKDGVAALLVCAPVNLVGTRVQNSISAGIYCSGSGFGQFDHNTVSGCAGYPLHIEAPYVSTLGSGNQLGFNGQDFIDVTGGAVTQDGVWARHGVPYKIQGIVDIGSQFAPRLYINSGVTLRFTRNSGIRVGGSLTGKLIASGVPDSIVFTGDESLPGAWQGIEFAEFSGSGSILERCRVLYAGGGAYGEVVVRNSTPRLINNEIGYSATNCIALFSSPLDPDTLRQHNWLHDWGEGYEDIYEEGP
ncbi:MAG: right-handed parallel beta-helix repeat-containing protein [bacterium]